MGKLVDSDAVVAMLQQEAKNWATMAEVARWPIAKTTAGAMSLGYTAAAEDVETFAKEQAEGSVPTDDSE